LAAARLDADRRARPLRPGGGLDALAAGPGVPDRLRRHRRLHRLRLVVAGGVAGADIHLRLRQSGGGGLPRLGARRRAAERGHAGRGGGDPDRCGPHQHVAGKDGGPKEGGAGAGLRGGRGGGVRGAIGPDKDEKDGKDSNDRLFSVFLPPLPRGEEGRGGEGAGGTATAPSRAADWIGGSPYGFFTSTGAASGSRRIFASSTCLRKAATSVAKKRLKSASTAWAADSATRRVSRCVGLG